MLSGQSAEDYYREVAFQEILRFQDVFYPLIVDLKSGDFSLSEIRGRCKSYPVRTIIAKEFTPATFQVLKIRRIPLMIISMICSFTGYGKDDQMEPLCITDWQSQKFSEMIGEDLHGFPAYANEFVNSKSIIVHRDDIDFEALSPLEKKVFRVNTSGIDEILSSDPVRTPTIAELNLKEFVGLGQFFFIDAVGFPYIYTFFYVKIGKHMLEFGLRMNVPDEHVEDVIRWMLDRNIEINLTTTEIHHEEY